MARSERIWTRLAGTKSGWVLIVLAITATAVGTAGCGQIQPSKATPGKTRVRFGGAEKLTSTLLASESRLMSGPLLTAGLVIYAVGQAGTENIQSIQFGDEDLATAAAGVDITDGTYKFYAVGFDDGTMTAMRCGIGNSGSLVVLTGEAVTVSIDLTAAGCNSTDFGEATFSPGGTLKPIVLHSCAAGGGAGVSCGLSCGSCTAGAAGSFRVTLANPGFAGGHGIGHCVVAGSAGAASSPAIFLPVSNDVGTGLFPFPAEVDAFASADCTGLPANAVPLPFGLKMGSPSALLKRGSSAGDNNHLYVDDSI